MRAKRAASAAAGLALAVLLQVTAYCEGLIPLTLKVFPQNATISIDGVLIPPAGAVRSPRILSLAAGSHLLALSADGYVPRELRVELVRQMSVEVKLERTGSRLVRLGQAATGSQPKSVAFTPDGRFILCALLEGQGVEVFARNGLTRVATLTPPAPWPAQKGFVETAVLAGRDELWVSQMTTSMAHVFRLSDFSYLASVATGGSWPKVITASPDESTIFVSNWESHSVSVIDTAARTVVGRIPVSGVPRGMALSRDGRFLYVCLFDRGVVQKVDVVKRTVAKSLSFGGGAMRHVVLHPSRDELYISDMLRGRLLVVDAARDALLAEIKVDRNLNTIVLTPDGRFLFVSSRGPNNPEDYTKKGPAFGTVSCIDTELRQVVDWTWGGNQPTGLAVSPDGRSVAFSNFLDDSLELYVFTADN